MVKEAKLRPGLTMSTTRGVEDGMTTERVRV